MLSTIAFILLLPYFGWGIYALRLRYQYHEELSLVTEAVTLLGLMAFYYLEFLLLREALEGNRVQFMVAVLGLITSGAALYGHMAISFTSRLIVEAVVPGPDTRDDRPRLGPAEALERQKDYEGALQEYYVIARTYPKDATVHLRIAHLQVQLGRPEEALPWLDRADKWASSEAQALAVANRRAEVLERQLGRLEGARAALQAFVERYPASREAEALRARIEGIGKAAPGPDTSVLAALDAAPLAEEPMGQDQLIAKPARRKAVSSKMPAASVGERLGPGHESGLTALGDSPVMAERIEKYTIEEKAAGTVVSMGLEKLEEAAPLVEDLTEQQRLGSAPVIALECMDDIAPDSGERDPHTK